MLSMISTARPASVQAAGSSAAEDSIGTQGIEPVTRTYNTLMIACNTSGQWQTALQLYEEMRAAGHALNTTSYNALISAHSKAGDLSQVLDTYRQMVQQVCPLPSQRHAFQLSA